eukprot:589379-Rhodomonas_salina.8
MSMSATAFILPSAADASSIFPGRPPQLEMSFAQYKWYRVPPFNASSSGVPPHRSQQFGFALRLSRYETTSTRPSAAARCSGYRAS